MKTSDKLRRNTLIGVMLFLCTTFYGYAQTLPYLQSFSDEEANNEMTIIDANGDDCTWVITEGKAEYTTNLFDEFSADDWLITPQLSLEANQSYIVSFKVKAFDNETPEKLEIKYGNRATAEEMKQTIAETMVVDYGEYKEMSFLITIDHTDMYHIGFHCVSDADKMALSIDDISIREAAVAKAPAEVKMLRVIPDSKGGLQAEIRFVSPSTAFDNSKLQSLDSIVVIRNDTVKVAKIDAPASDKEFVVTDNSPQNGNSIYKVTAYNEAGQSNPTTISAFIGMDVPQAVKQPVQTVENEDVCIKWRAPEEGWNGYYINKDSLTYTIYETSDGINRQPVAENITDTVWLIKGRANEGNQKQIFYQVYAQSRAGKGPVANSNVLLVGKPYPLPFTETLVNGKLSTYWLLEKTAQEDKLLSAKDDADGTNGCFMLKGAAAGNVITLSSGKIALNKELPINLTYTYHFETTDAKVYRMIVKDGVQLDSVSLNPSSAWKTDTVSLVSFAEKEAYIQVVFKALFMEDGKAVYVDNVKVDNVTTNNIDLTERQTGQVSEIFTVNGIRISKPHKGINLMRDTNGRVRKIIVK